MLIRLYGHSREGMDELIYIEGLPDSLLFELRKDGTRRLRAPWEPDVLENIPRSIRDFYCKTPVKVVMAYPPVEKGAPPILDETDVYAVRLDFQTTPGAETWKSVERMLDHETPRDMPVPKPKIVGDRRDWTLDVSDVPAIRLEPKSGNKVLFKPLEPVRESSAVEPMPPAEIFNCPDCAKEFTNAHGRMIHQTKMHKKKKEPIGA